MPVGDYIANCPDFWRLPTADLLYFGDNAYWLGNLTSTEQQNAAAGPPPTQHNMKNSSIFFKAVTASQSFAPGTMATKGFWDESSGRFLWWGWVQARPPHENEVAPWNGLLTVVSAAEHHFTILDTVLRLDGNSVCSVRALDLSIFKTLN